MVDTTTTDVDHGLATGNKVRIQSVGVNTAANGIWAVTVVSATAAAHAAQELVPALNKAGTIARAGG